MGCIVSLKGYEALDSRGRPTVACLATLDDGSQGYAMVPSGASTGRREALELRDGDPKRYHGLGVKQALSHIHDLILPKVRGMQARSQEALDAALCDLDGTANKSRLGANATLAVSLAVAHAASASQGMPLYRYLAGDGLVWESPSALMNVINGGAHAANQLDVQEFMIVPFGAGSFAESVRWGSEIAHVLRQALCQKGFHVGVGDEGGVAPELRSTEEALDWLMRAIEMAGLRPGEDVALALDVASSEFYREGHYQYAGKRYDAGAWLDCLVGWVERYPIISVEDGMAEDDWDGWALLTEALGGRIQLVGDDCFVTQASWLQKGIDANVANAILIKPNQVGTLTETLQTVAMAQQAGYGVVMSHRSGETEDVTLADLTVATQAGQIKTGGLCRSERMAKYNRLMMIEQACREGH